MLGLLSLLASPVAAQGFLLTDAGQTDLRGTVALVVMTPGVRPEAYMEWVRALEDQGLDAWTLRFPSAGQSPEDIVASLSTVRFPNREMVVAAHGLAGVFVLQSDLNPSRQALIATPLAAHPVALSLKAPPPVVSEALPLNHLLGKLPTEPYSAALAQAYQDWTRVFPQYTEPRAPTLLIASGADPLAPPEVVRLPSIDWSDRVWERAGPLGLDTHTYTHADLLRDRRVAERVARFLAEGS